LASTTTCQNNKAIREVGSSKVRSIPHCETNQCCGFPTQASKFYENPSCVHVSLLEPYHMSTIPRIIHDPLPPIEIDGEHEYEVEDILDSRISNYQFQYLVH
jgi:hypothetical protein